jgi:hypothetical protein
LDLRRSIEGVWRKLENEDSLILFSNRYIREKNEGKRDERSRSTIGEMRNAYRILIGKPEGKKPLGRPRIDGRIILKWILKGIGCGMDSFDLGHEHLSGSSEHGNEPSGSIKGGECHVQLSDCQLLKKGCAPWSYSHKVQFNQVLIYKTYL